MPSGGARARSGPPADPNSGRSERRGKDGGWTDLPAKREGRAPKWPLAEHESASARAAEKALWSVMWRKPQAVMWDRLGQQWQVAAYVRAFLESTRPGAPASLKAATLRMEDTLGLSTLGLTALRWRITSDELAKAREQAPVAPAADRPAPQRRLRAVVGE